MDSLFQALFALIITLSGSTGSPAIANKTVQPVAIHNAAPAGISGAQDITTTNSVEITGTVQNVSGTITIDVAGQTITVTNGIEISGKVTPGATVQIEGKMINGQLVITEIQVLNGKGGDDKGQGDDKNGSSVDSNKDSGKDSGKDSNVNSGKNSGK